MASSKAFPGECVVNERLVFVTTSVDTSRLRLPTAEEIQRMADGEVRAALEPFLQEKHELQEQALQVARWVCYEIHPDACRFSSDLGNKSKAELEEMILELRCLEEDTKRHRRNEER